MQEAITGWTALKALDYFRILKCFPDVKYNDNGSHCEVVFLYTTYHNDFFNVISAPSKIYAPTNSQNL